MEPLMQREIARLAGLAGLLIALWVGAMIVAAVIAGSAVAAHGC